MNVKLPVEALDKIKLFENETDFFQLNDEVRLLAKDLLSSLLRKYVIEISLATENVSGFAFRINENRPEPHLFTCSPMGNVLETLNNSFFKGFWGEYTMTLAVNGKLYDLNEKDVDKTYSLVTQRDLNFYQLLDELGKTYD